MLSSAFGPVTALLSIPEHKTPLPGGRAESQSDVFLLARHAGGTIACTIEGKVDEAFGNPLSKWLEQASPGKLERLAYICALLGIDQCPPDVHYQLLHRTAAALVEAERFCTADAAMIVYSFSPERRWHDAFARFVTVLGGVLHNDKVVLPMASGRRLLLAWVSGDQRYRSA